MAGISSLAVKITYPLHADRTGKEGNKKLNDFLIYVLSQVYSDDYRKYFTVVGGQLTDIPEDGGKFSAYFVSNVLLRFGLIKTGHCTVASTIADMEVSGWRRTNQRMSGAVVVWEKKLQASGAVTSHIGFLITPLAAVSHVDLYRAPITHEIYYRFGENIPKRKIEAIYRHPALKP